jgi:hypothetical protein
MHATCLTHLILLDMITSILFSEDYKWLRSSQHSFLQLLLTTSLSRTNILLCDLFSNNLNLRPSLRVRDQLPEPCMKLQF